MVVRSRGARRGSTPWSRVGATSSRHGWRFRIHECEQSQGGALGLTEVDARQKGESFNPVDDRVAVAVLLFGGFEQASRLKVDPCRVHDPVALQRRRTLKAPHDYRSRIASRARKPVMS